MPALIGIRDRRHAVYYDTLVNAGTYKAADPAVGSTTKLFQGLNLGETHWTNMLKAGCLPSDNTMLVRGISVDARFVGQRKEDADRLRELLLGHMHVRLVVGSKSLFDTMATDLTFDLGEAQKQLEEARVEEKADTVYMIEPYYLLEKPIAIPARQGFHITTHIAGPHTEDVLNGLNKPWDCWRCVRVGLTGLHTRDVM